ncbi:MAG: serine/threonine protein phosphatase [Desulfovibrio sp.]|nr:serine/threonine protein phosphatase [Desulfovibrio sp.]
MRKRIVFSSLCLLLALLLGFPTLDAAFCANRKEAAPKVLTVYDNQTQVSEKELMRFLEILPEFRSWARRQHEEAHPLLTAGRPDFFYSDNAALWIKNKGWDPKRFFCIMGRMAAALVIAEEGNDLKGIRPADMPAVSDAETELAHRHLGQLLKAGGAAAPTVDIGTPVLPAKP